MAKRNGGIIGPSNVPTGQYGGTASGVWRLRDAFNYIKAGVWPATGTYPINNSLRFNKGSSDYLSRIPASAGSTTKGTFSLWFKISELSATRGGDYQIFYSVSDGGNRFLISIDNNDNLFIGQYNGSSWDFLYTSTQVLRDVSAWYNIVVAIDTTQGTASNRVRTYLNGSEVTSWGTQTNPSSSLSVIMFKNSTTEIGRYAHTSGQYYAGYIAEQYGIDGQQLTPSSFGQTDSATGIWTPSPYTGTFGTNGFYLKFANSAALGTDSSGNANTFTANNLTSVDQSTDTPTNNFATMNSVDRNTGGTVAVFTEGNLTVAHLSGASGSHTIARSTIAVNKGKWYSEYKMTIPGGTNRVGIIDIAQINYVTYSNPFIGVFSAGYAYMSSGSIENNGTSTAYGASWTTNDIIGIALDCDNGTLIFYKNGVSQGTAFTGLDTSLYYAFSSSPYNDQTGSHNFGSPAYSANSYTDGAGYGNFSYAVPAGYYSLCTKNLAEYA